MKQKHFNGIQFEAKDYAVIKAYCLRLGFCIRRWATSELLKATKNKTVTKTMEADTSGFLKTIAEVEQQIKTLSNSIASGDKKKKD